MIATSQQCKNTGTNRSHTRTKTDTGQALLHTIELRFQRFYRRINLSTVGIALALALKNGSKLMCVFVAIGHGCVNRFVQRAMLNFGAPITVNHCASEPLERLFWRFAHVSLK